MHARPVREQWVFGAYDVEEKRGWIQLVDDRSANTLLPLIQEWCLPGTIIVSDGWAAYNGVVNLGFEHRVVIHENHFVDPLTGTHTNNVEAYWQRCKRRFKRMYGTSHALLASHLDEFLWLERNGKTFSDRFFNTLKILRMHYDG
jgi:transposase-like protein